MDNEATEATSLKRSTFLTIMHILLTNELSAEKPRAVDPGPDLTLVSPTPKAKTPKTKTNPFTNYGPDADSDSDSDSYFSTMFNRKKADKGKVKAINQWEGDPNTGPASRVCY